MSIFNAKENKAGDAVTSKMSKHKKSLLLLFLVFLFLLLVYSLYYFIVYQNSLVNDTTTRTVEKVSEKVISLLDEDNKELSSEEKIEVGNMFTKYITCKTNVFYPPIIREMINKDDILAPLLLFDRFERWDTDKICPETLTKSCKENSVLRGYGVPLSFCDNVCDKLLVYDNNYDQLEKEIVENSFLNWENSDILSNFWELRAIIAYRYGGSLLLDQVCRTLDRGDEDDCLMYKNTITNSYNLGSEMINDFIEKAPFGEIDKMNKKLSVKLDKYFGKYLMNKNRNYKTDQICPVVLETECIENEVRETYMPESFCNNLCNKLSYYDKNRSSMIDEIIENSFKDWEDGASLSNWPFLRFAIAYRYGGYDLAERVCKDTARWSEQECLLELKKSLEILLTEVNEEFTCDNINSKIESYLQ